MGTTHPKERTMTSETLIEETGWVPFTAKNGQTRLHLMRPNLSGKTVCGRYTTERLEEDRAFGSVPPRCGACASPGAPKRSA